MDHNASLGASNLYAWRTSEMTQADHQGQISLFIFFSTILKNKASSVVGMSVLVKKHDVKKPVLLLNMAQSRVLASRDPGAVVTCRAMQKETVVVADGVH